MINWVKPTSPRKLLIVALCLALAGVYLVESTVVKVKHPHFPEQVAAAKLMQEALDVLKQTRQELGIPINKELDPNETGIIGETFTAITSSQGNLEAKRTSTNPAFAALLVRLFHEAGLEKGDAVAIGASGSFPGLILATLAACEALELQPLVVYSVGSSMYGANLPEFTFIHMLAYLREQGILPYELLAVSLGGDNDRGEGMFFPESQDLMLEIAQSAGLPIIFAENTGASIAHRLELYKKANHDQPPSCFVNVGGATPNYGNTNASLNFPNGLVLSSSIRTADPERGLIFEYLEQGVPVIHLLNIRDLALKSGITIDPVPFPPIGTEDVYFQTQHNKYLIWIIFALVAGALFLGKEYK